MKKVRLEDIANKMGVSKTLVSMVLNGYGDKNGIKKETQERVIALTRELDYKPNQMARSLRLGKSNTIGLIVADISNAFYAKMARNIEDECNKYGYNLIICSSDEKDAKEASLIRMLKDKQVDGLIISSTLVDNSEIITLKQENFPFVLIDRYFPEISDTNYVIIDNYKSSFKAVKYLIDAGHQNIAMLSISPSHLTSVKDRNKGYFDAIKKANINTDHYLHCQIPFENIEQSVENSIEKLLKYERKITALLTVNQNIALATLRAFKKFKVKIPEDISLITFDDLPIFELLTPALTAISQPLNIISSNAVRVLMDEINTKDNNRTKDQIIIPSQFILRDSCKQIKLNKT